MFTYAANNLNQYTTVTETPAGGPAVPLSFAYDLNGNLTSDGRNTYTYDGENRLTHVTMADPGHWWEGEVAYDYDAFGRREARHVTPAGSGTTYTTRFLADGDYDIAEYTDVSGVLELQYRYVYGPGVDEPIAVVEVDHNTVAGTFTQASIAFYHQDRRGNVIALSAQDGTLGVAHTYDPYGQPDSWTGNPIRFTARWAEHEVGLYYYRARFYSPALGRFLQTDPIGYGDNMNMYAYVGGDPMNAGDPSGMTGEQSARNSTSPISCTAGSGELEHQAQATNSIVAGLSASAGSERTATGSADAGTGTGDPDEPDDLEIRQWGSIPLLERIILQFQRSRLEIRSQGENSEIVHVYRYFDSQCTKMAAGPNLSVHPGLTDRIT